MRFACAVLSVCLTLSISGHVRGDVPVYGYFQLQARANFGSGFNLPGGAFFANINVQVNDSGKVALSLSILPPPNDLKKGVWFGGNGSGSIVAMTEDDAFLSNLTLNNQNNMVWEQTLSSQNGLWEYDSTTMTAARKTTFPLGASSWGSPTINDFNQIGYRVNFAGNGQAYYSFNPTPPSVLLHVAEVGVLPESLYSFLFTPAFNNNRQIAGKVRLGGPGQTGNGQPDQIRIFNSDGSSTLIAEDRDSNPTSPYTAFDNSVALTDDGRVAFIANLFAGGRGVFLSDGVNTLQIANSNVGPATNIEFFGPAVNEKGWVVFRAFEGSLRAIWVGDGTALRRVVREHDILPSDLGDARVDQNGANDPVFSGGVTINECGDIAFSAGLTPPDNDQIEWGTGAYVAMATRNAKGDMNCDCAVGMADLDGFVLALIDPISYEDGNPDCHLANADMNSDANVDGTDVAGFVDLMMQ